MLPLLAGVIAAISSLQIVFVISLIAAIVQSTILVRINVSTAKAPMPLSRINR
jgi:hypothetical protein